MEPSASTRWLRRAGWAALVAVALAAGVVIVHGPFGPYPGGPLLGERVAEPVDDWSFADRHLEIQVETRIAGVVPFSVTTWCVSRDGRLYISADDGAEKVWVRAILEDPDARIRVGGRVYPVRFRPLTSPADLDLVWRLELDKYMGGEAGAAEMPFTPATLRFEVESRRAS